MRDDFVSPDLDTNGEGSSWLSTYIITGIITGIINPIFRRRPRL
jgi:hypothetical protein